MIVLCGGLPRSGSTLQFNIVKLLLNHSDNNVDVLDWVPADRLVEELERKISIDSNRIYLCKSHRPPEELNRLKSAIMILTTFRDPRDVLVSNKNAFGNGYDKTLIDIKLALDHISLIEANLHVSSYEGLVNDMPEEIIDIARFLEIPLVQGRVEEIADDLNVEKARESTQASRLSQISRTVERKLRFLFGLPPKYRNQELRLHPNHVSEELGSGGYYKKHMNTELALNVLEELEESYTHIGVNLKGECR